MGYTEKFEIPNCVDCERPLIRDEILCSTPRRGPICHDCLAKDMDACDVAIDELSSRVAELESEVAQYKMRESNPDKLYRRGVEDEDMISANVKADRPGRCAKVRRITTYFGLRSSLKKRKSELIGTDDQSDDFVQVVSDGTSGKAVAPDHGTAASGDRGISISGDYGLSLSGLHGEVASGDYGILVGTYWDSNAAQTRRVTVGYTAPDGLKPNTLYHLDGRGRWVESEKEIRFESDADFLHALLKNDKKSNCRRFLGTQNVWFTYGKKCERVETDKGDPE